MDREYANIIKLCLQETGISKFYIKEIPKDFKVPSIFFPLPLTTHQVDTVNSYVNLSQVYIKLFDSKNNTENTGHITAYENAVKIADKIKNERNIIRMYNENGTLSDDYMRLTDNVDIKEIEDGVQLTLEYRQRNTFTRPTYATIDNFLLNVGIKQEV